MPSPVSWSRFISTLVLLAGVGCGAKAEAEASEEANTKAASPSPTSKLAAKEAAEVEGAPAVVGKVGAAKDDDAGVEPSPPGEHSAETKPTEALDLSRYYWASRQGGKAVIDIIDPLGTTPEDDPVMTLAEAHGHPDGRERSLPEGAALPAGFARGDEWVISDVITPRRGKAIAFGATTGASESHFTVVLDVDGAGLATRADTWTGLVPRLRTVPRVTLTEGSGKVVFEAVAAGVSRLAGREAKQAMKGRVIEPSHLQAIEGEFPDGFTHLVALTLPLRREPGADHVAGMLLADASGRVEVVYPIQLTIDFYQLQYLVDLDGDGQDEVIWKSHYFEGDYIELLAWDATGARMGRTLTCDGA